MSIKENQEKIKAFLGSRSSQDVMTVMILVLVALGSFGLGRLSKVSGDNGITIIYPDDYKTMIKSNSQDLEGKREEDSKNPVSSEEEVVETVKTEVLGAEISSDPTKLIVASKRGTKYYYSWCSGAKNLSEANKVYFSTEEEAISAGYSKSTSCK